MTDEVQAAEDALTQSAHVEDTRTPMEKAITGGYMPEAEPSKEERAAELVAGMEHAVAHNAPITQATLMEVRDLLNVPKPDPTPPAPEGSVDLRSD